MQESTLRAVVGDLVRTRPATAYGIFNAVYGLALLAGGSLLGFLYERSIPMLVSYDADAQVIVMVVFAPLRLVRRHRKATSDGSCRCR